MADFTLPEILSKLQALSTSSDAKGSPVMQQFDCPVVIDANTTFNNAYTVLMMYWTPFKLINDTCLGDANGNTSNSLNKKLKTCSEGHPCSSYGKLPSKNCTREQILNELLLETNCRVTAYQEYQTCLQTGVNNNSLSYYRDRVQESLTVAIAAYDKLQAAILECRKLKGKEITGIETA